MDFKIRYLAIVQAVYYAITGIWPIVHIHSFMEVTGPKVDLWLVKLIGGLTVSISVVVFFTGIRRRIRIENLLVIIISSISYLLTDIINVAQGLISKIYLADAVLQIFFISAWLALAIKQKPFHHG